MKRDRAREQRGEEGEERKRRCSSKSGLSEQVARDEGHRFVVCCSRREAARGSLVCSCRTVSIAGSMLSSRQRLAARGPERKPFRGAARRQSYFGAPAGPERRNQR